MQSAVKQFGLQSRDAIQWRFQHREALILPGAQGADDPQAGTVDESALRKIGIHAIRIAGHGASALRIGEHGRRRLRKLFEDKRSLKMQNGIAVFAAGTDLDSHAVCGWQQACFKRDLSLVKDHRICPVDMREPGRGFAFYAEVSRGTSYFQQRSAA